MSCKNMQGSPGPTSSFISCPNMGGAQRHAEVCLHKCPEACSAYRNLPKAIKDKAFESLKNKGLEIVMPAYLEGI